MHTIFPYIRLQILTEPTFAMMISMPVYLATELRDRYSCWRSVAGRHCIVWHLMLELPLKSNSFSLVEAFSNLKNDINFRILCYGTDTSRFLYCSCYGQYTTEQWYRNITIIESVCNAPWRRNITIVVSMKCTARQKHYHYCKYTMHSDAETLLFILCYHLTCVRSHHLGLL